MFYCWLFFCVGGLDYNFQVYKLIFPVGETRKLIEAYAIDDNIVEETEYFNLNIINPQDHNVRVGRYGETKIMIYDDDSKYLHNLCFLYNVLWFI